MLHLQIFLCRISTLTEILIVSMDKSKILNDKILIKKYPFEPTGVHPEKV